MQKNKTHYHLPIMVGEVIDAFGLVKNAPLKNSDKKKIVDATLGTGGHTLAFINVGARVLGIEWDKNIFDIAEDRLTKACPASDFPQKPFKLVNSSYENIENICKENDFLGCDGVLLDLGVNSLHFDFKGRGFSFSDEDSPLDMRFNPEERAVDASALLNLLDKNSLMKLFADLMDYKNARDLTLAVIKQRKEKAYKIVGDFKSTIEKVIPRTGKLSVETLPFMALRMAVNTELENLQDVLPKAISVLKAGGVLAVISFHSGEDKIVKNYFKIMSENRSGNILTKRPIKPKKIEVEQNPRARSAKLRCIKKI